MGDISYQLSGMKEGIIITDPTDSKTVFENLDEMETFWGRYNYPNSLIQKEAT